MTIQDSCGSVSQSVGQSTESGYLSGSYVDRYGAGTQAEPEEQVSEVHGHDGGGTRAWNLGSVSRLVEVSFQPSITYIANMTKI